MRSPTCLPQTMRLSSRTCCGRRGNGGNYNSILVLCEGGHRATTKTPTEQPRMHMAPPTPQCENDNRHATREQHHPLRVPDTSANRAQTPAYRPRDHACGGLTVDRTCESHFRPTHPQRPHHTRAQSRWTEAKHSVRRGRKGYT